MISELEQRLVPYITSLIEQGNLLLSSTRIDDRLFSSFKTGCLNVNRLLGSQGAPWRTAFDLIASARRSRVEEMVGALESVRHAILSNVFVRIEDLVAGKVFDDMLEQAEYLHEKVHDVAAAVIARGVLEEHLRRWCRFADFTPTSNMIDGFNVALCKGPPSKYDKAVMQHVTAMAAIGNKAAHELVATKEDTKRMLEDVRRFLAQHPIS